jgi:hypothetical protein
MTLNEYEEKLQAQKEKCCICGGSNYKGIALAVDHNHITGRVRGLLCNRCNTVIGLIEESPDLLQEMSQYMKENV